MPPGEEMFKFRGYSGPCPKPPLPRKSYKLVLSKLARTATFIGQDGRVVAQLGFAMGPEADAFRDKLVEMFGGAD